MEALTSSTRSANLWLMCYLDSHHPIHVIYSKIFQSDHSPNVILLENSLVQQCFLHCYHPLMWADYENSSLDFFKGPWNSWFLCDATYVVSRHLETFSLRSCWHRKWSKKYAINFFVLEKGRSRINTYHNNISGLAWQLEVTRVSQKVSLVLVKYSFSKRIKRINMRCNSGFPM